MAKKGRPKSNNPKEEMIHFAYTTDEKEKLESIAEDSNLSISEFIRQAIKDKIRKIENPDIFQENVKLEVDHKKLKEILEISGMNAQKIDLLINKMEILEKIENTFKILDKYVNRPALEQKEQMIVGLLQEHGELKLNKMIDLSGFSKEEIYDIISNTQKFGINIKSGGIKLNE
jgi:ribosome-associated translation inhibitor RaiA